MLVDQQNKYIKRVQPFYDYFLRRKVRNNKSFSITLRSLCNAVDIDIKCFYGDLKKFDSIIYQICTPGTRIVKDSICVQLPDSTDDDLRQASNNGSIVLVTDHKIDELSCIVVDNPIDVYIKMCSYYRDKVSVEVTAVIGSIGKTTTKKIINSVYRRCFKTFCDEGNENLIFNAGYHCQHIPMNSEKWIQEVSEDQPGFASAVSRMIKPNIAIITTIDNAHIGNFKNEEGIIKEICSIVDGMNNGSTIIVNKDEFHYYNLLRDNIKLITISSNDTKADFYLTKLSISSEGLYFSVKDNTSNGDIIPFCMPGVYAEHNAIAALYAIACGVFAKIPYKEIQAGIKEFRPCGIRQNVYDTIGGKYKIYADCYNAVPKSIKSAIETMLLINRESKHIAVLADVEELGEFSEDIHNDIIKFLNNSSLDYVILFGEKICKAAKNMNSREGLTIYTCKTYLEIEKYLKQIIRKGDVILFKGSRKSHLETCIKDLFPLTYMREHIRAIYPYYKWRIQVIMN